MSKELTLTTYKAIREVQALLNPERKYFFGKYTAVRVHDTYISVVFIYQPLFGIHREKSSKITIPKDITYEQMVNDMFTKIEKKQ